MNKICSSLTLCIFCRADDKARMVLFKDKASEYEACPKGWTLENLPSKEAVREAAALTKYKKKNYPCCDGTRNE